ncbi:AAA15 family ATPase/GTPase [Acinetobacter lwoffii]|uniref:AAA15 family ATPase/GTPase n=2 Tax=Acinetobacter TaxID=469 RepID=A0AAW8LMV9_ACILW|nr:AAA family ATPase [Acinetobacter lwoffii]MDR6630099.1 AAA15 family ATPase/GTPase [Acinetobacter lwoffii]
MTEKLYYWAENLETYRSDNVADYDQIIEIKRLNFFIGKNNAGKSRFLRSIFATPLEFSDINYIDPTPYLESLKEKAIDVYPRNFGFQNSYGGNLKDSFLDKVNLLINEKSVASKNQFKNILDTHLKEISKFHITGNATRFSEISSIYSRENRNFLTINSFNNKFYIPILRGMRPVTEQENKQPYIERAQKDYFPNKDKFDSKNIITGECLYHELQIHLLGKPKQRELIKNYEEKLSQYFFDNEPITLIPFIGKDDNGHVNDVVHIKIGEDDQFPIHRLGDGLQQAIILTYEAFIKKEEIHAFFIEEPELHMHAGMVRQLMNFYLNETPHYYFFTTHSNHLLDMADESDQVMIQKFVKQPKVDNPSKFDFKIHRCDRDRDLLASLGVRPSSIYLANCTIWVEGITDRLYITKYMQKYLDVLKQEETLVVEGKPNNLDLYKFRSSDIQRLMPNYHYTFVEYAGSNLTHWDFSDEFTDHLDDCGMNALLTSSSVFLIADGDIKTKNKGMRATSLEEKLGEKFFLLECKETENTLPSNIIYHACRIKFLGLNGAFQDDETKRNALSNHLSMDGMQADTKEGFDIVTLIEEHDYFHAKNGIGKILDDQIRVGNPRTTDDKPKKCFSDQSGTIKEKLKFCRLVLTVMDHVEWELTESAKELCEKIFEHIISENPLPNKKTA